MRRMVEFLTEHGRGLLLTEEKLAREDVFLLTLNCYRTDKRGILVKKKKHTVFLLFTLSTQLIYYYQT